MGNLISYEVQIKYKETEKGINRKNIALNISTDSEESEEEEDEDISLLTRRFKKFIKNGKYKRNGKFPEKSNNKDETPRCYKCNKPGHIKRDCPLLKMKTFKKDNNNFKKFKKKILQAIWEDSDSSSDEESPSENESADMYFMAQGDNPCSSPEIDTEELLDAFNDLYEKYKNLKVKSKNMTLNIDHLNSVNDSLIEEGKKMVLENEELDQKNVELNMSLGQMKYKINNLEKDISFLKDKSNDLLNAVTKFTKGKQNLDLLLSNQRKTLYKHGIGFSPFQNTPYENGFIRETTKEKYVFVTRKQNSKWVPRNKYGIIHQKKIWVPKTLLSSNVGK